VKARPPKLETEPPKDDAGARGLTAVCADTTGEGIDFSLLEDSLAKTPWERMLANDDALRFADSLRAAVEERNAKPERIDAATH
jgi:hypothetical protein